MNTMVKETPTNSITWFDIATIGVYITPELICGRPCILLLSTSSIFKTHELLEGQLENNEFQMVRFEFDTEHRENLYLLFTDKIDSTFFTKDLRIPTNNIFSYTASLVDIQSVFYKKAQDFFGFRVDVLVRSSTFLGLNHSNNEVYTSNFGRFKISYVGFENDEKIFRTESPSESNIAFLRAISLKDVFFCSQGFVLAAIKTRRNVTLADVIRFAAIIYQDENKPIDIKNVKLYQITNILNVFNALYTANIITATDTQIKSDSFFDNKQHYKNVSLNYEACPSPPRAIYTDYLASQYKTPAPLAFVMQKLLIHGDTYTDQTVLDPMVGLGSLITILAKKEYAVTGLEKNPNTHKLALELKLDHVKFECVDSIQIDIAEYLPKGEKFNYVICNPACLKSEIKYEYRDQIKDSNIVVTRTDFIALLRTLTIREDDGRSVFLLPFFTTDDVDFAVNQINEVERLLNFVNTRFNIEGCIGISSEIYSKSLGKISPLLVVIGAKREEPVTAKIRFVKEALDNLINDYEELWDWASVLCYKRSDRYLDDKDIFEETQKTFSQRYSEANNQLELPIPVNETEEDIDFSDSEPPKVEQKSFGLNYSVADSMFSSILGMPDKSETPETSDEAPKTPETSDEAPKTPETSDEAPKTPETSDEAPKTPETSDEAPKTPETSDETPKTPETSDETPKTPETSGETQDNEDKKTNTPSSSRIDLLKKPIGLNQITKDSGNFFNIEQRSKIIRYHSLASLSDPSSNVYLSEFRSYLLAKRNLNQAIIDSYNSFSLENKDAKKEVFSKKIQAYLDTNKLNISIESFLGAHLELNEPKTFTHFFKSEHLDFIAASILKFSNSESVFLADSLGMNTDIPLATLIHFYRLNERGIVYIAKDEKSINSLIKTFNYLNEHLFKQDAVKFLVAHRFADVEKVVSSFNKGEVLVLLNEPHVLSKLRKKNLSNVLNDLSTFNCICDTDLGKAKQPVALINQALRSGTIFRSNNWISPETNLSMLSGLFTKNVNERYFQSLNGGLDDMSSHLLKLNLIENFSVFERFEDLSNIPLSMNNHDLWKGKYNVLAQSYSKAINNIVILAEEIHRGIVEKKDYHQRLTNIRSVAMKIYELCTFCISTIPLTHSIFSALKNQSKPIVIIPNNIEEVLFSLLENMQVELIGDLSKESISTLTQLNQLIEMKFRAYNENYAKLYESEQSEELKQAKQEIDKLIFIRTTSINSYLTSSKTGTISKYPDVTGLISAFYKNCSLDIEESKISNPNLSTIAKKIEEEIETLADLPLCVADFLQYELSQYKIKTTEISSRSFSIQYDDQNNLWKPKEVSPFSTLNDTQKIADAFNGGEIDLLIIETDKAMGTDLSSFKGDSKHFSDYMRKRVLFLTYFNQPIEHYLKLIHSINSFEQFTSPEISLEVPDSPIQKAFAELLVQQLAKYNIHGVSSNFTKPDLSYYLTESGQKLLVEYLKLNPSYQAHHPNLAINKWTLLNVLNIADMVDVNMQDEIIEHLAYFTKQHLEYLRDIKCNPFDLFVVSEKARYSLKNIDNESLYLNKKLNSADASFKKDIAIVTLEYVKNTINSFSLDDCKEIYKAQSDLEVNRLKNIISKFTSFSGKSIKLDSLRHSELLTVYIENYTNYLISVYRDKVFYQLNDRYGNWIFKNRICSLTYLKTHFIGKNGVKVSDVLGSLYCEIAMLGDAELLKDFEKSCEVATFLNCYQLAVKKQESDGYSQPILISVPSPFNDKLHSIQEGFLMKINIPSSIMLALSPKAFSVSVAYPNKSKVIDLSLAYVLENKDVLKGQQILPMLNSTKIEIILQSYHKSKYKDLLAKKLAENAFKKALPFTGLPYLNSSTHHATIREFLKEKLPTKIRTMDVLVGNLFEIYYMLHKKYPLTMVSFINDKGLTQHGFVIPSDINIGDVVTCLVRRTSVHNILKIYHLCTKQNSPLTSLRSIQWFGASGIVETAKINSELVNISFIGSELELQKILLDEDVFEEYPIKPANDEDPIIIENGNRSKKEKEKYKFMPLDISDANIVHMGNKLNYQLKISQKQLLDFITLVIKKQLFDGVLVDFDSQNDRNQMRKVFNKD